MENLNGWVGMVYQIIVDNYTGRDFTLADMELHDNVYQQYYPNNNTRMDSVRNILQHLRDLNIIQFVNWNGIYRYNTNHGISINEIKNKIAALNSKIGTIDKPIRLSRAKAWDYIILTYGRMKANNVPAFFEFSLDPTRIFLDCQEYAKKAGFSDIVREFAFITI